MQMFVYEPCRSLHRESYITPTDYSTIYEKLKLLKAANQIVEHFEFEPRSPEMYPGVANESGPARTPFAQWFRPLKSQGALIDPSQYIP